jgi:hypothetical protein
LILGTSRTILCWDMLPNESFSIIPNVYTNHVSTPATKMLGIQAFLALPALCWASVLV